jgi:hypothetical protein
MSDDEDTTSTNLTSMGGKMKKSNGHKMSCMCPICKNMMKKGGSPETDESQIDDQSSPMLGGRRRKTRTRKGGKRVKRRSGKRTRKSRKSRRSRKH